METIGQSLHYYLYGRHYNEVNIKYTHAFAVGIFFEKTAVFVNFLCENIDIYSEYVIK